MQVLGGHRVIAAAFLWAAFSMAPAFGMSVSYYMDQANISPFPDGHNYLKVTISDGAGGNIDFKVEALASLDGLAAADYGLDSFGFNSTLGSMTVSNFSLPSDWSVKFNKNQDGFGEFEYVVDTSGNSSLLDPLMFSIVGIAGDTPINYVSLSSGNAGEGNVYFGAHVKSFTTSPDSGYFGGSAPVPEPETYAMLLAGLGLVGFAARRKLA